MEKKICWVASTDEDDEKTKTRKGPWTSEEDMKLIRYISLHGQGRWNFLAKAAGLKRTGKSCRLRWNNCLRPDLKRSKITPEEERLIIELHGRWGNRWSRIAESLPGRTDNEIKNCWRTRIKRKLNLQAKGRNSGMDADNRIDFEFSKGSHSLTTTSEILSDLDSAEPSSSFPRQSTGEIEVQTNKTPNLQNDIWAQAIPVIEENYDSVLQGEIDHGSSEIIEDGQPWLALTEHCEGTDNLFEKSSLNHFSVRSLIATLISSGATEDDTIPNSPETFSDSEFYFIDYSDVLWNMDEEDECFIPSSHCYEQ